MKYACPLPSRLYTHVGTDNKNNPNKYSIKDSRINLRYIISYVFLTHKTWVTTYSVYIVHYVVVFKALTLCPKAKKCRPHHGGGCTRPHAMTTVAGIYARRLVNSLVPAYEALCVWVAGPKEWPLEDIPPS